MAGLFLVELLSMPDQTLFNTLTKIFLHLADWHLNSSLMNKEQVKKNCSIKTIIDIFVTSLQNDCFIAFFLKRTRNN